LVFELKYWWIIQSLESYEQHSDLIGGGFKEGTEHLLHPKFAEIEKGDYIVLYATGDKVLLGIFEVNSEMETLRNDEYWNDTPIFKIKPAFMPTDGFYVDWKKMLFDPSLKFNLFPEKDRWTYKIWKHYIHPLDAKDFENIKSAILTHRYETSAEIEEKTISDRLGPAFRTIDLLFEPVDEMGTVYMFAKHHREIGFPFIVKLRAKYPDVIAIDTKGNRKLIELEFRSSNFNHDPKGCDFIVCWIDDLEENMKKNLPQIIDLRKSLSNFYSKQAANE
jgi:hypothetical protein